MKALASGLLVKAMALASQRSFLPFSTRWATLPRRMVSVKGAAYLKLEPGKSIGLFPRQA